MRLCTPALDCAGCCLHDGLNFLDKSNMSNFGPRWPEHTTAFPLICFCRLFELQMYSHLILKFPYRLVGTLHCLHKPPPAWAFASRKLNREKCKSTSLFCGHPFLLKSRTLQRVESRQSSDAGTHLPQGSVSRAFKGGRLLTVVAALIWGLFGLRQSYLKCLAAVWCLSSTSCFSLTAAHWQRVSVCCAFFFAKKKTKNLTHAALTARESQQAESTATKTTSVSYDTKVTTQSEIAEQSKPGMMSLAFWTKRYKAPCFLE